MLWTGLLKISRNLITFDLFKHNPDYFLLTTLIALFYFRNLLTQPGTGTTCARARLCAYFNFCIFFILLLTKSKFLSIEVYATKNIKG